MPPPPPAEPAGATGPATYPATGHPRRAPDHPPRAAVAPFALDAVKARAGDLATVVALDEQLDLSTIEFLVPSGAEPYAVEQLPGLHRLQVVQLLSAGSDWIEDRLPPQATLCTARGARDGPVSEWVLAALLGASSQLLACARIHTWTERHNSDLGSATVVIVGMGSIGRMLAQRLKMLGTTVLGVVSQARDGLHGIDELDGLLPAADAVVLLAPLTASTRHLIGAPQLAAMRDGALLVNAGRGPLVDTEALLHQVQTGRLRAVLDVTDPEPLPDDHPLWTAPGVLSITPHIAGDSPAGNARAAALAGEQLRRWCTGEPLRNVVRPGSP